MTFQNNLIQKTLTTHQADAFLLSSSASRFWYTNLATSAGFVLVFKDKSLWFLDQRYYQKAYDLHPVGYELVVYKSKQQLLEACMQYQVQNLLVEQESFLYTDYLFFCQNKIKITPYLADLLRIQKTPAEIAKIQKAVDITAKALNWLQKQDLIGLSEIEVANMITYKMLKLGAIKNAFDPIVASGPNGAYPHHQPNERVIENDEFVTVDVGCIYQGYCSDLTRTFPIGIPSEKLIQAYKTVFQASNLAIAAAKKQTTTGEIDAVARQTIEKTPFAKAFLHATGHGVGIKVHEYPIIAPQTQYVLAENMVITIEPGIYLPNLGGIRIEDMLHIGVDLPHVMSFSAKKWVF